MVVAGGYPTDCVRRMNPHAVQLVRSADVNISVFPSFFAYSFFGIVLLLALRAGGSDRRETLGLLGLFTWCTVVTGVAFWWLGLQDNPRDAIFYWRWSSILSDSWFSTEFMTALSKGGLGNLGVRAFILLEAVVTIVLPARFEVLTILNILLSIMAIFFIGRTANILFGEDKKFMTHALFLFYFSMYWRTNHNLREAIILFFMGASMWSFFRWRQTGRTTSLIVAISTALLSTIFRIENVIIFTSFVSLYALLSARTVAQLLPRTVIVIAAAAASIHLAFEVTGGDPLRAINFARKLRLEGGYSLVLPDLESYADIILQLPRTFVFFLVPVLPWQIDIGAQYLLNFGHSLTALPLFLLGMIGAIAAVRRHREGKMIAVLVLSLFVMASVYSMAEISAESSARHSLFWYYCLMPFAAYGVERARAGAFKLATAYAKNGLLPGHNFSKRFAPRRPER